MIGQKFNRWTVIRQTDKRGSGGLVIFECRCDCGTVRDIPGARVRSGETKSCGCLMKERARAANVTHGMTNTPLRNAWNSMMQRCYNPKNPRYPRYGARGIVVCERWMDAAKFIEDNKPLWAHGLSIDRIDNDGPYAPENVRWTSVAVQNANTSQNRNYTFNGKTRCLKAWSRDLGISHSGLRKRLALGWSVERAFSEPVDQKMVASHLLTLDGRTQNLASWSRELGIEKSAIQRRLARGWTVERALTTPVHRP